MVTERGDRKRGVLGAAGRHMFSLACAAVFAYAGANAHAADVSKSDAKDQSAQPEWSDPLFNQPYIDVDEWRDTPVRHRYVHGGFKGTGTKFSFYFPPKEQYQGRFFETASPVPQSENTAQRGKGETIAFAISSGAYFVETNQNGPENTPNACVRSDPSIAGYRANAAGGQYSRTVAEEMYGTKKRPYGYLYGGSGGSFRTAAGVEKTPVWDGSVPYVMGTGLSLPSMLTVRLNAVHMLDGKFPGVVDAIDVGGSGDMYAGLDPDQRQALLEATKMGLNPKTWAGYKSMSLGVYPILIGPILCGDPTYVNDFWTVPGYGGVNPSDFIKKAHFEQQTTITKLLTQEDADQMKLVLQTQGFTIIPAVDAWKGLLAEGGKPIVAIQTAAMPSGDLEGAILTMKSGTATGDTIRFDRAVGNIIPLRYGIGATDPHVVAKLNVGDKVQIDNSTFLAVMLYHRYQVPPKDKYSDYHAWDQYVGADGKPIYPQRPVLEGPSFAYNGSGAIQSGDFHGKMILVESMQDEGFFPWQADWYRTQVKKVFGAKSDDKFRVWMTDNAMHGGTEGFPTHFVNYQGIVQQALRDVSAWAEKGIAPPASTGYKVDSDSQVTLPPDAKERKGIQPVVTLRANGVQRAEVKAGEPVNLTATIDVPTGTGKVISAAWDFESTGNEDDYTPEQQTAKEAAYTPADIVVASDGGATVKASHVYATPGTYFAVLHATSQRQGDAKTPFARVENLDRVRIVVR